MPCLKAVPDEIVAHTLSFLCGEDLGRCRRLDRDVRAVAGREALWAGACAQVGLTRPGSSRVGARTYVTWHDTWVASRCGECFGRMLYSVNLSGGASRYRHYGGAKIAVCEACGDRAAECYATIGSNKRVCGELLPRLTAAWGVDAVLRVGRTMPTKVDDDDGDGGQRVGFRENPIDV